MRPYLASRFQCHREIAKIKDWCAKPKNKAGSLRCRAGRKELLTLAPLSKQLKPQGDTPETCLPFPFMLKARGSSFYPECCCIMYYNSILKSIQHHKHPHVKLLCQKALLLCDLDGVIIPSFDMTRSEPWVEIYCSSANCQDRSEHVIHVNVNAKLVSREHLQCTASG